MKVKKGSFDLTGKAVDCRDLHNFSGSEELIRALQVATNGDYFRDYNKIMYTPTIACDTIEPYQVIGQAAINAAMDGATIVFEGDVIPANQYGIKSYYEDSDVMEWKENQEEDLVIDRIGDGEIPILAYKLLAEMEELSNHPKANDAIANARVLAEKVGAADVLTAGAKHLNDRAATYDSAEGERSMGATVEAFESITGHSLTEEQGWLFMVILKAVRSQQGNYKLDNYEDGAAYFALMAESASEARK